MTTGYLIRKYRNRKGLTQEQLAAHIGISQNFLSNIENDRSDFPVSLLYKIAGALEICPCKLIVCNSKE